MFSTFLMIVVEDVIVAPVFAKNPLFELFKVTIIPLVIPEKSAVSVLSPPSII